MLSLLELQLVQPGMSKAEKSNSSIIIHKASKFNAY